VHSWTLADRFEALENRDVLRAIGRGRFLAVLLGHRIAFQARDARQHGARAILFNSSAFWPQFLAFEGHLWTVPRPANFWSSRPPTRRWGEVAAQTDSSVGREWPPRPRPSPPCVRTANPVRAQGPRTLARRKRLGRAIC